MHACYYFELLKHERCYRSVRDYKLNVMLQCAAVLAHSCLMSTLSVDVLARAHNCLRSRDVCNLQVETDALYAE
jgi:hypothetical protein